MGRRTAQHARVRPQTGSTSPTLSQTIRSVRLQAVTACVRASCTVRDDRPLQGPVMATNGIRLIPLEAWP